MKFRFRNVLLILAVAPSLVLAAGLRAEDSARAADSSASPSPRSGEVDVEKLDELIRKAKQLRVARQKQESEKSPPVAARASTEPAGKAAEAERTASEGDDAEAEAEESEPTPVEQAGCMYRNDRLIWERAPGTCSP